MASPTGHWGKDYQSDSGVISSRRRFLDNCLPMAALRQAPNARRKKNIKVPTRITLETPYSLDWPEVKPESIFLEAVTSTFKSLNVRKVTKITGRSKDLQLTWKEKNALKKQQSKEKWDKCKCHRQHLVLGMSNALRSLEKDELCALLLCRDVSPPFMLDPFASLCISRKVPAAAVSKLGETMQKLLNFKSCKALGFKRSVSNDPSNVFYALYELICTTAPSLHRKNFGAVIEAAVATISTIVHDVDVTDEPAVERPPQKDYSHLYVKKADVIQLAPEFIPFKASNEVLDTNENPVQVDFISVNLERKKVQATNAYKQMKIKRIKPSNKIKLKRLKKPKTN